MQQTVCDACKQVVASSEEGIIHLTRLSVASVTRSQGGDISSPTGKSESELCALCSGEVKRLLARFLADK